MNLQHIQSKLQTASDSPPKLPILVSILDHLTINLHHFFSFPGRTAVHVHVYVDFYVHVRVYVRFDVHSQLQKYSLPKNFVF